MAMALELKPGQSFDPPSLDLPSMGALVRFYHACVGLPVKLTWLNAIKASNSNSLPGLTYSNAAQYCPDADKTIKGHLAQQRQNVKSNRPNGRPPCNPQWCQDHSRNKSHCIKSLSKQSPSANCIRMTPGSSQSKPDQETSTS